MIESALRHAMTGCCGPSPASAEPDGGERFDQLVDALLAFMDISGVLGKTPQKSDRERRAIAARIDRLAADGTPWPSFQIGSGDPSKPVLPVTTPLERARTRRPRRGYCVRWNGAFWIPCQTQRERRDAGYVSLTMRWAGPKPHVGSILCSGPRARHAYRIHEVERFDTPRGTKRYTCRLWCERIAPDLIPKRTTVHAIYWDARGKSRP
jgi:hypothetical protein